MNVKQAHYRNASKQYNTSEHIVYSCQYHVIFCPKYRRPVLTPPIDGRLKELFYEVADQYGFSIPDLEVMPDHVHMVIDCNPRFGVCNCVKLLKGTTSRVLREEFSSLKSRLPSLWTHSYFVSSVGSVSLETVKKYIADQKNR